MNSSRVSAASIARLRSGTLVEKLLVEVPKGHITLLSHHSPNPLPSLTFPSPSTLCHLATTLSFTPMAEAKISLSYPLYCADFDPYNFNYLFVGGGGGEGRSGVGNKIVRIYPN
jgi:hypothetical protein